MKIVPEISLRHDLQYFLFISTPTIDIEPKKCKETGEEKTIVFGLTGTGYFDLVAYQKFNDHEMTDTIPTDEQLAASIAQLPKVEG